MTAQSASARHAEELLARRRARRDIRDYIRYIRPAGLLDTKYDPADHHEIFLDAAMDMVDNPSEQNRQLMVAMPPGAGKSTYLSVLLPTFLLARDPTIQIIAVAPSDTLSEKFARQRREICRTPEWQRIAQGSLQKDAQSLTFMGRPEGGYIRSASVGASIMGQRADVVLVDELATSFEQASSIGQMQKVFDWYVSTARTRLSPQGIEMILSTRWSTADLIGRFLAAKEAGEEPHWKYIRIPMVCDDPQDPLDRKLGQRLWPSWYTKEQVRVARLNPLLWKTIFQQTPADATGQWVSPEHFLYEQDAPDTLRYIIGCDLALSVNKGDFSVAVVGGVDQHGDLHIVDMYREQSSPNDFADAIIALSKKYSPQWVLFDNSNAEKMFKHTLYSQCRAQNVNLPFHMLPIGNRQKEDRASVLRAKMLQDQVKFLRRDWTTAALDEVLSFPSPTTHDDIIDSMSLIARHMSKVSPPKPEKVEQAVPALQIGPGGVISCTESLDDMFKQLDRAPQRSFEKLRL